MPDSVYSSEQEARGADCFKEAVCIDAMRIYDSCSDKECSSYRMWGKKILSYL